MSIEIPYGRRPKVGIRRIEAGDRTFYFQEKGGITVNEMPPAMQELKRIGDEVRLIFIGAAQKIQKDYPVDLDHAFVKVYDLGLFSISSAETINQVTTAKRVDKGATEITFTPASHILRLNDWVIFPGVSQPVIIAERMGDHTYKTEPIGQAISKSEIGSCVEMQQSDYLTEAEILRLQELTAESPKAALEATTLFMRYRVLYPIEAISGQDEADGFGDVKPNAESIRVPELNISLQTGDRIKFPSQDGGRSVVVTVACGCSPSEEDQEWVEIKIEKCPGLIREGSTGFIMEGRGLRSGTAWQVLSDPEFSQWSDEIRDAKIAETWPIELSRMLDEEMVKAIYLYHQEESRRVSSKASKDSKDSAMSEGNGKSSSSKSEPKKQLTGTSTTGESKDTEPVTSDSTDKTLVAA